MKPNKVELESAIIVMSHLLKVQNFSAFKVSCLYKQFLTRLSFSPLSQWSKLSRSGWQRLFMTAQ